MRSTEHAVDVFLTADIELWPVTKGLGVRDAMMRHIYGKTSRGDYGLPFQLRMLDDYGLKATFFVESLFASVVGIEPLAEIVSMIKSAGQDVQLHLHPQWLRQDGMATQKSLCSHMLQHLSVEAQSDLIALGLDRLADAGARDVCAFRAGDFSANLETLHALKINGVSYDSSYSFVHLDNDCAMRLGRPLLQPEEIHGVHEYPITFFNDLPGHYRPAQLCACSFDELQGLMEEAHQRRWNSFVLLWHGAEMISRHKPGADEPRRVLISRFKHLCKYLSKHRSALRTRTFSDLRNSGPSRASTVPPARHPLRSSALRTAQRMLKQAIARWV